ncbi:MAG: SpoIIE family protein phosphatase, partial [Chloroflexi bacterium]|nr:SpoIIE family protein phosphatase [Chloroflexota bacterium]
MSKQRGSSFVGSAQDVGGAADGVQHERVRTGPVQTADGRRLLLSVLGVGTDSGESAARVVEQVFQSVSGAQARNVRRALKRGLEIASQGLIRRGEEVAVAAVAIHRNQVVFASIGNNVVFRVAGKKAILLTKASNSRLGAEGAPQIQSGSVVLERGDRVLVGSAALIAPSPADGKPFVDPKLIPEHIQNLPPEDAAKHLVSIALGRDVDSNVTVA